MGALKRICQQLECPELLESLEYALYRFGFRDEHVAYGAEHISEWYDLDLPSVRKLLTAYLKEFCSLYEETTAYKIYVSVPSPTVLSVALNETGRVRIYTAELCAMIVLRGILGLNIDGFGNCCDSHSRCAMLENRSEFLKRGFIPKPDLLWSFGLLCDECPKTDEAVQNIQTLKTLSTTCPRDYRGESESQYYEALLREDIQSVCELAEIPVPNGEQAWQKAKLLGILVNTISCKVSGADYPLLKAATLSLLQSTQLMSFGDFDGLLAGLQNLLRELRTIRKDGKRKKLYCYYIPPCLPELGIIFEKNGIALVGGAAFLTAPVKRSCSGDLAGYCATSWQSCILSRSVKANAEATAAMILKDRCDGYLSGMFEFDRWLGSNHKLSAGRIEALSGKPVFECHVDFWGRSVSIPRIEIYAETVSSMLD